MSSGVTSVVHYNWPVLGIVTNLLSLCWSIDIQIEYKR